MSTSTKGALVVIGSGPGIGRTTAAHFASQGFQHIFLLSRNESRLAEDAKAVSAASSAAKVETLQIDVAGDEASLKKVFSEIDSKLKATGVPLEVVLYNAARVGPSKILEWEVKQLEEDLKITTVSLYITFQWAIPHLVETSKSDSHNPAFFVTSGDLFRAPFPFLFSLSAGKAAQHNLVSSFHKAYSSQMHIAAVPIAGTVSDDAKVTTAQAVAEQFWKLYSQEKGKEGEMSVEMRDPDYESGVEELRKMVQGS
ncbi:hypothetical protein LTR64_000042 [Lithohypha guttulata]|uniref:uncharacterized protein n=1 Tax=Lithohypha guttulata TaxID=1690604 RepID=UPI002DE0D1E0|nr:hypothetical protein LTR51_007404 [Lithohypha guttulata]